MILYHGSPKKLFSIKKSQAKSQEGVEVPDGELLNAIYLTSEFEVALAMGARPKGITVMGGEGVNRTIAFENPESFNPQKRVFVYGVNSERIPDNNLRKIDEEQYAVIGINKIKPDYIEERKSEDVLRYFKVVDFPNNYSN